MCAKAMTLTLVKKLQVSTTRGIDFGLLSKTSYPYVTRYLDRGRPRHWQLRVLRINSQLTLLQLKLFYHYAG